MYPLVKNSTNYRRASGLKLASLIPVMQLSYRGPHNLEIRKTYSVAGSVY